LSKELANQLMDAESVEAFLAQQTRPVGWKRFAALKLEVDRLVHTDLTIAANLVERLEQLTKLTIDEISLAFVQASRARLLHLQGQHSSAYDFYESAIKTLQRLGLVKEAARLQKQQIDTLTETGRYKDALRIAGSARRILAQDDQIQLAQLETNVGNIYYMLDRYKKALEHYDKARTILTKRGDNTMRAVVDFSRANIFTELDQPDKALALFEKSAAAYEKAGMLLNAGQARFHIAYLQFLRGNYNTALSNYYQVRDKLKALGSLQLVAWCDLEIAEILLSLNAFDDAIESATNAQQQFKTLGMQYEFAKSLLTLALAEIALQYFARAESNLGQARDVFAANKNSTFVAVVDLYLAELGIRRGDAPEALRCAESALRVFARQKLATKSAHAHLLMARVAYQLKDQAKALRMAKAALHNIDKHFAPTVAYQCFHLTGRIERDRKRNQAALENFHRAIEIIEQMRSTVAADEFKASFLRDKIEVYEDAIQACLDAGSPKLLEEAFRLVESSKSRALADLLAHYLRDTTESQSLCKPAEAEAREKLLKLIEDLNWYSAQTRREDEKGGQRKAKLAERYDREIEKCERQITQLFARMESLGSDFAEIRQMQAIGSADLREALEEGENLVEYFATGNEVSAFVASPDEIKLVRGIASKGEIERLMSTLRFQLEKFNYGAQFADEHFEQLHHAISQHLIEIYRKVFAVLEPQLHGKKLIIIPHGALHYVPFHALLDRRGYLIDRFEISYAPSATVLRLCRMRGKQASANGGHKSGKTTGNQKITLSSVAQAKYNTGKVVALGIGDKETPNIEAEIQALSRIFPDTVALMGNEATRSNLLKLAPGARFLHLASHSYFRRDNPMFSFLKLVDSPLNFYNLLDLQLQAEMVTLSACHTGMNMVFPGDELHGLMRGFLYAGAPSLVASLWAANDISTAEFMSKMYERISLGETKRQAIRAAQLAIKDAYGHPYYWAPFVLMGNPN
jgi:CHAT domain-containing protein